MSSSLDRQRPQGAIETFIIDWPVHILVGLLFGSFARSDRWWRSRWFLGGLISSAAFLTAALLSYAVAPDWMWSYFLDPDDVAWSVPLIALGFLFCYLLGFAAALSLRTIGRSALVAAIVFTLLLEVVSIALTWDRYRVVGTRREWQLGQAHELFSTSPTGPVRTLGLLGPTFFIVSVGAFLWSRRERHADTARR